MGLSRTTILRLGKVANIGVSLAIAILAATRFSTDKLLNVTDGIWTFYWIAFALLIILAELNVSIVLQYFGFLKGYCGKGVFVIFMGTLLLNNWSISYVFGIIFIVVGIVYIYLNYKVEKDEQLPAGSAEASPALQNKKGLGNDPAKGDIAPEANAAEGIN